LSDWHSHKESGKHPLRTYLIMSPACGGRALRDRAWAVPTPEREPETVTKPSPAPDGDNCASESD